MMESNCLQPDEFTLIAEFVLNKVEEEKRLLDAIEKGDMRPFTAVMKSILKHEFTWGDHLKRYLYQAANAGQLTLQKPWVDMNDWSQDDVIQLLQDIFRINEMEDRGSIDPKVTSSSLKKNIKRWLNSPVTSIGRNTCFLFAFGLNMSEMDAAYFLDVLRQPGFNPRDYKEAIYYYCLYNRAGYARVTQWLNKCDQWLKDMDRETDGSGADLKATTVLRDELKQISGLVLGSEEKDRLFETYLKDLLRAAPSRKKSQTRANIYRTLYDDFNQTFSSKAVMWYDRNLNKKCFDDFERALKEYPTDSIKIDDVVIELLKKDLLDFPALTASSLEKKIGKEQSTEVTREDILTMAFLNSTYQYEYVPLDEEDKKSDKPVDYYERKADFVNLVDRSLESCGFGELYMLNPYELFLTACLLQTKPLQYFLAVWKLSQDENRGKST